MFTSQLTRALLGFLLAAVVSACSSVLGIEAAQCSPDYPECRTGSALCNDYCSRIMSNCVDDLTQYTTQENCLSVCARLPAGQPGDTQINSVQCRLTQAKAAHDLSTAEKVSTCAAAGPGGSLACGDPCQAVCSIMSSACTGQNQKFDTEDDCKISCGEVPSLDVPYTASPTSPENSDMQRSNHQECRLYHACAASEAAVPHCGHAAGESVCAGNTP